MNVTIFLETIERVGFNPTPTIDQLTSGSQNTKLLKTRATALLPCRAVKTTILVLLRTYEPPPLKQP